MQLLPVRMKIRATAPSNSPALDEVGTVSEPIAVAQRMTEGILKIIFWYVARGDSTKVREEGTQQDNEDFDTVWASFDEVASILSFDDDRKIALYAIDLVTATYQS